MSTTTVEPTFPGRLTAAFSMIVAPAALTLLCLVGTGIYKFHGRDFLTAMAAHRIRTQIFLNAVPFAIFLLMLAVIGLAGMAAHRGSRLAGPAGSITLLGLCGPLFFVAIEFCGYQLANPKHLAAGAHMYDLANTVPRISLNVSGPAIIVGFITLAIACYRAGLLTKARAVCLGLTALLPFGFIAAVLPISALGFFACCFALVPAGLDLMRSTRPGAEVPAQATTSVSDRGAMAGQP